MAEIDAWSIRICWNEKCFIYSLKTVPQVSKTQVWKNLMQLLEEATSEDDIHDVEFLVSLWHMHLLSHNVILWLNHLVLFNFCLGYTLENYYYGLVLADLEKATRQQWRQYAQIKKKGAWSVVGRQIGHRKSSSAFSARFPVLNWHSRSVAKLL